MKKLGLLLLLFSFVTVTHAQRVLFSTPIDNSLSVYVKDVSNRQYMVYAWQNTATAFYTPHLLWFDRKGQQTRNILSPDSFNVIGSSSINVYGSGYMLETLQWTNDPVQWKRVFFYLDQAGNVNWKRSFTNGFVPYNYGYSYIIEPNKQISVIAIDTTGKATIEVVDSNGLTLKTWAVQKNLQRLLAFNLLKISDNRYLFAANGGYAPPTPTLDQSSLVCIDSSGTVIWETAFYNDTLSTGIIDNAILLNNHLYVKTWEEDSAGLFTTYILHKLSLDGTILQQRTISTKAISHEFENKLIPSKDQGFYLFLNELTYNDVSRIEKYDQDLNVKWSRSFPEFIYSIDSSSCNGIVRSIDNFSANQSSKIEAFVDPELEDVCNKCETVVYPNPSSKDFFNVRSAYPDVYLQSTELYDMSGRLMWKFDIAESDNQFMINHNLADGTYLCRIGCENGKSQMKRVVVNR